MKKTLLMLALVAGLTSFAQNATAALVTINIGPSPGFDIGGINAGLSNGGSVLKFAFPIVGGSPSDNLLILQNNYNGTGSGLEGQVGLSFAAGSTPATPVKFGPNASIGIGSSYVSANNSNFKNGSTISPDFGPGSYMGFMTSQGNYGWLEVTWTAASNEFQIFSGAYESVAGSSIVTPAAAPIPEPGTWAAMAIFAGGAAYSGWRRRKSVKVSE